MEDDILMVNYILFVMKYHFVDEMMMMMIMNNNHYHLIFLLLNLDLI